MAGTSHRDLVVWQLGIDLVGACYELTRALPSEERFGLISQMRRAAISVPANISEGHARRSRLAYAHHVSSALGCLDCTDRFPRPRACAAILEVVRPPASDL